MLMQFTCGNYTKIVKLLFCILAWCQSVKTLTEFANLGQNVSITCNLSEKEFYWMLLKPPNRPVTILRLFSTSPTPFYTDVNLISKYSVKQKHSLFITNVTSEELGVYYCMTTDAPPTFSNGTKLQIKGQTKLPEYQSHTVVTYIERNHSVVTYTEQLQRPCSIIILLSALTNAVLVIVVGCVCCYSGENVKCQTADLEFTPLEQLQESKTVYTEVVFSLVCEEFEQKITQISNTRAFS
ncbi:uncharacterized protein LOC130215503 [Danio aesculapii]|uniref:uncharacterized protein LOC130215503 n=1 Tax=Danio aesculapii TaxID=1142201 RepID=UPI0024C0042B|nr:uncharacterized protein LOC130215503 [Danio aesculapii]